MGQNEAWIARLDTPRIINVLTHGGNPGGSLDPAAFNPEDAGWTTFRADFNALQDKFDDMPGTNVTIVNNSTVTEHTTGSTYEGQVASYVAKWYSSPGFVQGLARVRAQWA